MALPTHKRSMELLFRDIYNTITGMCLDPFTRVLHEVELQDWSTVYTGNGDGLLFPPTVVGIVGGLFGTRCPSRRGCW